jgi:hypothetical protein
MGEPKDPEELKLVRLAISLDVRGCCEWDEQEARRIDAQPPLPGLTPEGLRELLQEFVRKEGEIVQVEEKRQERDRPFYYKAIIPVSGLRHGLFVEVVLVDDDAEYPAVHIVNAHEQRR